MDFLVVSIGILLSTVVRRLLGFSSANTKIINKNVGVVLIFFYEVKYHVQTVSGMPPRPPKVILQVLVAPKPLKIIKILMNAMDFQMNPNEIFAGQILNFTRGEGEGGKSEFFKKTSKFYLK